MLILVFLFFFSLLVSILGLPLSYPQMVYVEHDQENTMTKRKRTKGQTTIFKTLHIKLKIK